MERHAKFEKPSFIRSEMDFDILSDVEMGIYIEEHTGSKEVSASKVQKLIGLVRQERSNLSQWLLDRAEELDVYIDFDSHSSTVRSHGEIVVSTYCEIEVDGMNVEDFWRKSSNLPRG